MKAMTDRQRTHGHDCWSWGAGHYDCAVAEIERLREALEEIRSRSSIWHGLSLMSASYRLGDIHQIAGAALSKENSDD